jgi:hypothetical protein
MISLKSRAQMELSFSPHKLDWRKLSQSRQHELLEQLSLLFLSNLADKTQEDDLAKEEQLCPVK